MIKVAIMGFGTIGSGVAEVLDINKKSIAARVGDEVELKYVLDLRDFEGDPIQEKIVHDYKVIAEDPEVAIVVETMGGVEPAYTFVKTMLEAGKNWNRAAGGNQSCDTDAEYYYEFRQRHHCGRCRPHCAVYRCRGKRGCQIHGKSDICLCHGICRGLCHTVFSGNTRYHQLAGS